MQETTLDIRQKLSGTYPDSEITGLIRIMIEFVTGLAYSRLLSDKSIKLSESQKLKINEITQRLLRHEPIQYIIGSTEFYGLPFKVNKNTLIPRPETEELVEQIIKESNSLKLDILDIGTGSGCIAISLKKHLLGASVEAWDISREAILTASENAEENNSNIKFQEVDVLTQYPQDQQFDIIVSNPPYILEMEKLQMDNNVLDYEPHVALFVPNDNPLLFYKRIADIGLDLLKPKGKLYFEINREQGERTCEMLLGKGYINIELIKDISGNDRIIKAERPILL